MDPVSIVRSTFMNTTAGTALAATDEKASEV